MHNPALLVSIQPPLADSRWKTDVQPQVSHTHLPTYKIIGATPRRAPTEDQAPQPPTSHRDPSRDPSTFALCTSSGLLSSRRKKSNRRRGATPVTRENLANMCMMSCARDEDLDAPISALAPVPLAVTKKRTSSDMSSSSSSTTKDLPCITEEEED